MKKPLFCLLLLAAATPAFSQTQPGAPTQNCFRIERLFDPAQPAALADIELSKLRVQAEEGNPYAAYLLGTLYRLGPAHPAQRLPHDPDAARDWLRKAALDGNLTAMAALAENELAAGRPMDAMVMAQLAIHYAGRFPDVPLASAKRYQAGLVSRAFEALGRVPSATHDAEILAAFKAFLAEHGETIEAALRRKPRHKAGCPPFHDNERWPATYIGRSHVVASTSDGARIQKVATPGYALYWAMVKPNGRIETLLVIDSLPARDVADALWGTAKEARYNKLRGAPPRAVLHPAVL